MALRAGYFGLKRFEKNKLSVLAASTPGDISPDNPIASKKDISATVDLLKDTTGWTGKNKFPNKTNIVGNNTYTVDSSGYVSTAVASDGRTWSYANSNIKFTLKKGTYKVRGYEKTASTSGYTGFHILDDNDNELLIASNWNSFMTDALTLTLAQDTNIGVEYKVGNGEYAFMITTLEQYALNESFEPYHESVAELLDGKLSIGSMLTSADDLNDIKTSGIYAFSTSPANTPEGVVYGTLIVEGNSSGSTGVRQLIIVSGTSSGIIYTRGYDGSPQTWKSWFKFTGTEVTPPSPTPESETKKATKKKVIKEEED